jgi:hypothetical protein
MAKATGFGLIRQLSMIEGDVRTAIREAQHNIRAARSGISDTLSRDGAVQPPEAKGILDWLAQAESALTGITGD